MGGTDAPQGTSLATATLVTSSPAWQGFSRLGLCLLQQHKAASAPWGCTFLSQGLILQSSAWCPGIHTHTPGLGDTQALRQSRCTPTIQGEGGQNGQPVHRPAAAFFAGSTDFITTCGDNSIKAASLKASAQDAGRGEPRSVLGAGAEHQVHSKLPGSWLPGGGRGPFAATLQHSSPPQGQALLGWVNRGLGQLS